MELPGYVQEIRRFPTLNREHRGCKPADQASMSAASASRLRFSAVQVWARYTR